MGRASEAVCFTSLLCCTLGLWQEPVLRAAMGSYLFFLPVLAALLFGDRTVIGQV